MTDDSAAANGASAGRVSFVMPAHNEEECIDEALQRCLSTLDQLEGGGEVIVVDDASDDRTPELLRIAAAKDPRITILRSDQNVGPQRCIMRGLLASTGEWAFVLPADLQVVASEVELCLPAGERADLVCTVRRPRADGFHRRAMSTAFNVMVRLFVGLPFHDLDSSFLIRRPVIEELVPRLRARSDFLQAELVARAVASDWRVTEVPIPHYERPAGRAAAITPSLVLRTFTDFGQLLRFLRRLRRDGVSGHGDAQ